MQWFGCIWSCNELHLGHFYGKIFFVQFLMEILNMHAYLHFGYFKFAILSHGKNLHDLKKKNFILEIRSSFRKHWSYLFLKLLHFYHLSLSFYNSCYLLEFRQ